MLRSLVLALLVLIVGCGGGGGTVVVIDANGPLTMVPDPPIVRANTSTKFIAFGLGHHPNQFEWRTGVFSERMTSNGVYSPGSTLGDELVIATVPGEAVMNRIARTIPSTVSIVFASDSTGQSEVWSVNENGTALTQWTTEGASEPVGSTHAPWFFFRKGQEIWVRTFLSGGTLEGVFDTFSSELQPLEVKYSFSGIDFLVAHHVLWRHSPKSGLVEYILIRNETEYLLVTPAEIDSFDTRNRRIILSIDDGVARQLFRLTGALELEQITSLPIDCVDPSNGLDGRTIYFAGSDGTQWDIYVLDEITLKVTNLTNTPDIDEEHPNLSPEGRRIVFSRGMVGAREIWTMKPDGKDKRRLVGGLGDCVHPDYLILSVP